MDFYKYQGAGNDFVLVDQRENRVLTREDRSRIEALCERRFGIGADGLILLENRAGFDFEMIYFNADGRESTLCGNGGRCIAALARHLGIAGESCRFWAIDGPHEARFGPPRAGGEEWVELKMNDVGTMEQNDGAFVLNTGSPHFVRFVGELPSLDIVREGRAVRYSERFRAEGINVNFVQSHPERLNIRTYERGVEDETLSCGTGITAAALAHARQAGLPPGPVEVAVQARGGNLSVRFRVQEDGSFTDIWLCGPARRVYTGTIE
jgi:diaminopimelate epimerase